MAQTWNDLLFAHYPVRSETISHLIPPELTLDTFEGEAWISITPFALANMRLRRLPPIPGTDDFCELNVRTYVTAEGKPGIWFFSLDAGNSLAVWGARRAFHLPYFRARMTCKTEQGITHYSSRRTHAQSPPAELRVDYHPTSAVNQARAGTLAHWLAERYCLYSRDRYGKVYRGEIHHVPWPLQDAEADIRLNTMTKQIDVQLSGAPLLHFAKRQDVLIWPIYPVAQ